MSLPRFSARRPVAVAMLLLAIVLLGLVSWVRLPIDLLPDLRYPELVVLTSYPGVAPSDVERRITEPVEAQAAAVPGVERVASVSREGVSLVTLRFAWGTDMDFALLDARERMDQLREALPESASRPRLLRVDPESEPVMVLSVSGPADPWDTREFTETVVRRRLEQLDGVAQASVTGGLEREIEVRLDPERLAAYGLAPADVASALDAANVSAPGGTIMRGLYRYPLRVLGELRSVREIEEVVVARRAGGETAAGSIRAVRVRDVAQVVDGFSEREAIARLDGREAVGLLLFKEAGANTVAVAREVEDVIGQLSVEHPAVRIDVASSQAGFIQAAIDNVVGQVIVGGLLAFLVLVLFLRDPRYPIVVSAAVPTSVLGTFALMDATGVSLNVMSLGGLALGIGMLTDNAVIVLENVVRHREAGKGAVEAAIAGAEEVTGAITASTVTTIAVFAPIVYVDGVAGELFRDLSLTIAYSLLASLLVALTLLPAWAARAGAAIPGAGADPTVGMGFARTLGPTLTPPLRAFDRGFAAFADRYERVLAAALDRPGRTLGWAGGAFAAALVVGGALPRDLLPEVDQGAFDVHVRLPEGTALAGASAAATALEGALGEDVAVVAVFTRVGRDARATALGGDATGRAGPNTAVLQVRVAEGRPAGPVMERLRPRAEALGDAEVTLRAGQATALGRIFGGEGADVAVRIRGEDPDAAYARAEVVAERLRTLPRLADVRVGMERGTPELRVEVLRDRAAAHRIEPGAVADAVEAAMRGRIATEYVDFDRKIPVVVRYPESLRTSRATLETLRVGGVPLRELVRVDEVLGPAEVRREDQGRVVTVEADVAGGGLDAAIAEVEDALGALPGVPGIRTEVGGANEEMRHSFRGLAFAFLLAALLVYMVLAAQFESFAHPFTILTSVPLAAVGAVLALLLTGQAVSTMSLIGLVILVGIVDNDAIVKVDFINRARAAGMGTREAIVEAGRKRLRPIVMTTLTTLGGLLPMALGFGRGAELQAPLAIVVVGGLAGATLLTLVVVPVVYLVVERTRGRERSLAEVLPVPVPAPLSASLPARVGRSADGT